jgi:hypothetical protein
MNWTKRTALAVAAGALLSLSAAGPSSATPIGVSATATALTRTDSNLVEVGNRRGGHRFDGRDRRRSGHFRHRGHRHGGDVPWWLAAPLLAAPFVSHGYDYDDPYDPYD